MLTIHEHLSEQTAGIIRSLYGSHTEASDVTVQDTLSHFRGDFTIVVFPFLKISGKGPEQTGEEIGRVLTDTMEEIHCFSVVKGFLNVTMSHAFWNMFLKESSGTEKFGFTPQKPGGRPVLVEFSSPNTNKPLHLGHIRNNLLGHAVSALLEAIGEEVIRVNLVNDRGIHICKSMLAWLKYGKGQTPSVTGTKGDKLVGEYYVLFDKAYKEEIKALIATGMEQQEAERQSELMGEAREMLRLWEEGDAQIRDLWSEMNSWVYEGFEATYRRLGIRFDKTYYESDTYLKGKAIVLDGVQSGALEQRDDKSVWIDLTPEGMDEKLLLRSDGTSVYITQDIGTALIRDREYSPSQMIYVVGNEQNYHFDVLVKVLERLGYDAAQKIRHLSYGMVELPSGKMKSREGTVVDADDLMEEMFHSARKVTAELGKWSEEELQELDDLFEMLGSGALKYYILKVDAKKQMLFNPEESIDFNGNTGPFIQYTHARIASLLRKAAENHPNETTHHWPDDYPLDDHELSVLKQIYRFPGVLKEAAATLNPALVANFSYELAKLFNQLYHNLSVLNDPDLEKVLFRVELSAITGKVLRSSMGLLGITLPEKM
jgi:arginyl-tRNA synthetase